MLEERKPLLGGLLAGDVVMLKSSKGPSNRADEEGALDGC